MRYDVKKLKALIYDDTQTIRALKKEGSRNSARSMKEQATIHHAIAAHLHGRIHLASRFLCNEKKMNLSPTWKEPYWKDGMSREEQAKFIASELSRFELKEELATTG